MKKSKLILYAYKKKNLKKNKKILARCQQPLFQDSN